MALDSIALAHKLLYFGHMIRNKLGRTEGTKRRGEDKNRTLTEVKETELCKNVCY